MVVGKISGDKPDGSVRKLEIEWVPKNCVGVVFENVDSIAAVEAADIDSFLATAAVDDVAAGVAADEDGIDIAAGTAVSDEGAARKIYRGGTEFVARWTEGADAN